MFKFKKYKKIIGIFFLILLSLFLYGKDIYRGYLVITNKLISKENIPQNKIRKNITVEKCNEEEKEYLKNNGYLKDNNCQKIKNHISVKYDNFSSLEDKPIFFITEDGLILSNNKKMYLFKTKDNINFLFLRENNYTSINTGSCLFLLSSLNLDIIDFYEMKGNSWYKDIYYDKKTSYTYILSQSKEEQDKYRLDKIAIYNNKYKLEESIVFLSYTTRPQYIEFIENNILYVSSEEIRGFEGYSIDIGIEKFDLNYWRKRNIKG